MPYLIPTDASASIALLDQFGRPAVAPADATVSFPDGTVASAALSADRSSIVITPIAVGTATLIYSSVSTSITLTASVSVQTPVPSALGATATLTELSA